MLYRIFPGSWLVFADGRFKATLEPIEIVNGIMIAGVGDSLEVRFSVEPLGANFNTLVKGSRDGSAVALMCLTASNSGSSDYSISSIVDPDQGSILMRRSYIITVQAHGH